jgi:predicted Holliday junction resolvase-like endonuclease
MGDIRKLPFLSGCSAAILAGILSYAAGVGSRTIYIRMAVMMFLFYLIGVLVKNTVLKIRKEQEEKGRERELEEARRRKREKEEKIREAIENRKNAAKGAGEQGNDLTMEEFKALSEAILTKAKE